MTVEDLDNMLNWYKDKPLLVEKYIAKNATDQEANIILDQLYQLYDEHKWEDFAPFQVVRSHTAPKDFAMPITREWRRDPPHDSVATSRPVIMTNMPKGSVITIIANTD